MKKLIYLILSILSLNINIKAMDGDLDPAFGTLGVVQTPNGFFVQAVAIQTDGKIVATGRHCLAS